MQSKASKPFLLTSGAEDLAAAIQSGAEVCNNLKHY
jgi:hypothetical protein